MTDVHLHVHIGPPKTGTTALQLTLQSLNLDGFRYLGTFQPRSNNVGSVAQALYDYVSSAEASLPSEQLVTLRDELETGHHTVISEEMFLVRSKSMSFWDKLERLEKLLHDIPHSYLITLRDPAEALPSYYQEIFRGVSVDQKLFPGRFFRSETCDCYDYKKIKEYLGNLGASVKFVDMKDLVRGQLTLDALLGTDGRFPEPLAVPKANVGAKEARSGHRVVGPVTASDLVSSLLPQSSIDLVRRILPRAVSRTRRTLDSLKIRPATVRNLNVPPERLSQLSASYVDCLKEK